MCVHRGITLHNSFSEASRMAGWERIVGKFAGMRKKVPQNLRKAARSAANRKLNSCGYCDTTRIHVEGRIISLTDSPGYCVSFCGMPHDPSKAISPLWACCPAPMARRRVVIGCENQSSTASEAADCSLAAEVLPSHQSSKRPPNRREQVPCDGSPSSDDMPSWPRRRRPLRACRGLHR